MTKPDTSIRQVKRLYSPKSQKAKSELQHALDIISAESDVKAIALTGGHVTFVDKEDYINLIHFEWQHRDGYAKRQQYKGKVISMHNAIMGTPEGFVCDHIDGDSLNNRRSNLRICKQQNNMWNRKPVKGSSSKFKGVSWQAATGYWKAYIKINEKQVHLGCFWDEEDAAIAYNKAAKALHGEFAKLNKVEDKPCLSQIVR